MSEQDINDSTYCDECQGPLAIPSDEDYDSTILYKRIHSVHCVKAEQSTPILPA